MTRERIELHREQETMLMTLYLHARDAGSAHPILGDPYAARVLERIDYDFGRFDKLAGNLPVIISRAKAIDDITRSFLADHAEAVVLHLGCGLDSRVQRINPDPSTAWFDIDQEPVINLRRKLVEDRIGVTTVAASVTQPYWWSAVPADRPTLILGEGLLMYLAPNDIRTLLDAALTRSRVAVQTLVFDTVAPWVRRVSAWQPNFREASAKFLSTTNDLDAAIDRQDGVTLLAEQSMVSLAREAARGPLATFISAMDALSFGHRAMVLRTYLHRPETPDLSR
ncbi:class I SAM-dependent methyltransferase [Mycobacterium sp. pUA109]|uniref:class I SAM-dependent methyltransferase n=1 Tax=Mycobacterium sp. pUA109 TaxID=3238982 RepID=UPI00351B5F1B